ncbi:hypothetical protein CK203_025022 [Vitis vinifera]|uniref:Retrotransposon gag domain-containing protein n=1 Tax=Vitis vinifera TaxID=29760 RepID=A0A438J6Y7_VITVI|nr:hypothetical protein CK203_025022 [Vitis vinifera]
MEAINACPHHGFDTWLLVSYFYNGMSSSMKQLLETMCGSDFMSKNPEEAMDFLSYVAEVSRDTDMKAKFATMARRLEELEVKKISKVQVISKTPVQAVLCSIFQSFEHLVEECPTMPAVREMFGDQANPRAPQYTQPDQVLLQASSLKQAIVNLSKVVGDFVGDQKSINSQLSQRIDSLDRKIDGRNPKSIHEIDAQERESSRLREVKAVITLRSGKEVDLPTSKLEKEPENEAEEKKMEEIKGKRKGNNTKKEDLEANVNEKLKRTTNQEEMIKNHMSSPFPQALHGKKGINNASENLEVLRQVKVNIPLLDMIKQVPTYAKFLKDLCTIKKGLNVSKKAFLTEQVSSIIQCKSPVKYKDSDCPTISVMIRETCVEKTLLDLGASVNLLPYSVYKQLGLGELKLTSITLSLADRSVKIPRGMIEDVLVQVDKFYYPVDFFVLDTDLVAKGTNCIPIILGRPFLATSNAIIHCKNGNLVEKHCDQKKLEELNESFGDLEEGLPKPLDLLATLPHLKLKEEILLLFNKEETQEVVKEESPKLILKPLPTELKYAYLEENK